MCKGLLLMRGRVPGPQMRIAQDRAKQMRVITLAFHSLARSSEVRLRAMEGWAEGQHMTTA
jgi:hypothetical protein